MTLNLNSNEKNFYLENAKKKIFTVQPIFFIDLLEFHVNELTVEKIKIT